MSLCFIQILCSSTKSEVSFAGYFTLIDTLICRNDTGCNLQLTKNFYNLIGSTFLSTRAVKVNSDIPISINKMKYCCPRKGDWDWVVPATGDEESGWVKREISERNLHYLSFCLCWCSYGSIPPLTCSHHFYTGTYCSEALADLDSLGPRCQVSCWT